MKKYSEKLESTIIQISMFSQVETELSSSRRLLKWSERILKNPGNLGKDILSQAKIDIETLKEKVSALSQFLKDRDKTTVSKLYN